MRTLDGSLTSLPNVTSFGADGSIYAQLFYDGQEEFYCSADSCKQDLGSGDGSSDWQCQNLKCTCIPGAQFCGGNPSLNLTQILDTLNGALEVSCDAPSSAGSTTSCAFKQSIINSVFGSAGLTLTGCSIGECVAQSVLDAASSNSTSSDDSDSHGSSLSGGVIAGLAVVGVLVALALAVLLFGWLRQRQARRAGSASWAKKAGGIGVAWTNISYFVPTSGSGGLFRRRGSSLNDAKAILDDVTGHIEPGQMMAILGPSGASGIIVSG